MAEQRAVVETYPEVAAYHARLGSLLALSAAGQGTGQDAGQGQEAEREAGQDAGQGQEAERDTGQEAEREFERARELEPLSAELEAKIGGYYQMAGDFEPAARAYERSVELEPENAYYRLKLGELYSTLATAGSSGADSQGASQEGSSQEGSSQGSSGASGTGGASEEGYYGKAERELERATELELLPWQEEGLRARAWVELGDLYGERGRESEARAAYEAALEADPDSPLARGKLEELR